jgi:hypothetical protein
MSVAFLHRSLATGQSKSFEELHVVGQNPSEFGEHGLGDGVHTSSQAKVGVILSSYVKMVSWFDCAAHPVAVGHPPPVASGDANIGAVGSQTSPGSTTPLPQTAEQLLSMFALQPAGQQLSPSLHAVVTPVIWHAAVQVPALASV